MKTHKNILLIEDDPDDQFLFKEFILKSEDANLVHIANNGEEALHWLNTTTALPDLIFSDINMPMMNGIDCFKQIMNTPAFCNLPVVFLSSDTSWIDHVGTLGAKTFIKKGSDDATMVKQIQHVIQAELFVDSLKPVISKHDKLLIKPGKKRMLIRKEKTVN